MERQELTRDVIFLRKSDSWFENSVAVAAFPRALLNV